MLHLSFLQSSDDLSYYLTHGTFVVDRSSPIVLLFCVMWQQMWRRNVWQTNVEEECVRMCWNVWECVHPNVSHDPAKCGLKSETAKTLTKNQEMPSSYISHSYNQATICPNIWHVELSSYVELVLYCPTISCYMATKWSKRMCENVWKCVRVCLSKCGCGN